MASQENEEPAEQRRHRFGCVCWLLAACWLYAAPVHAQPDIDELLALLEGSYSSDGVAQAGATYLTAERGFDDSGVQVFGAAPGENYLLQRR